MLGKTRDIKVGALYCFATWPGIRHLSHHDHDDDDDNYDDDDDEEEEEEAQDIAEGG